VAVPDPEKRTKRIVVRVPDSLHERIATLAEADNRKVADWAYLVIKHEVERLEDEKPVRPTPRRAPR
jgi:predicted HicB family RNase H-like nuclease